MSGLGSIPNGTGIDQLPRAPILQRELELKDFEHNGLESDF